MGSKKLKVNDRVKRSNSSGCNGTVKDVRQEITVSSASADKERPYLITVLWDNGTQSCFSPEALDIVKE